MRILKGLRQTVGRNVTDERATRLQNLVVNGTLTLARPYQENGPVYFRIAFLGRSGAPVEALLSGPEAEAFLLGVNAEKTRVHYALAPGQGKVNH